MLFTVERGRETGNIAGSGEKEEKSEKLEKPKQDTGLAAGTIASCDYTVKIPMSHGVDSLNVAAASAVAFWQLGRQ